MNKTKVVLITGITGQDGSYLAEFLLQKGYEVHGVRRRSSSFNTKRIDHIFNKLHIHYGEITDEGNIRSIIKAVQPNEIYNLASQSHVHVSFTIPRYTFDTIVPGLLNILNSVRDICPESRIYVASSSEIFGGSDKPLNEKSPFLPRSPYACAKLCAHHLAGVYREAYGLWISRGILFNHESPRRGETFVTRKITRGIAAILRKETNELVLGNLDAKRDWGYAPEFCEVMYKILQQDEPDDYVLGTGESRTIKEFVSAAFDYVGLDHTKFVRTDSIYMRPLEVDCLIADPSKAKEKLGWNPQVTFDQLVPIMVDADVSKGKSHE